VKPTCSLLPYELRLGVTGHRDIAAPEKVAEAVRSVLQRIDEVLEPSESTPLRKTIISPLARGADRIVADEVLRTADNRLEVITPFPTDEYVKDFDDDDDRREFEALFARRDHLEQIDTRPSNKKERDEGYLQCGERVVERCEILIAVWNGQPNKRGGPADIIEYALKRERLILWIHSERPDDPPRVIRALSREAGTLDIETYDFPRQAVALSPGYVQQKAYCSDPHLRESALNRALKKLREEVAHAAAGSGIPADELVSAVEPLLREHVRADLLAIKYQRRHLAVVVAILYLAAAAVTVGIAQVLFWLDHRLIALEVLAMIAVFVSFRLNRKGRWHERWLHDRFLAERLRTAIYTSVIAAPRQDDRSEEPLPFYRGPHHWMAMTLRVLQRRMAAAPHVPLATMKHFLRRAWLQEQRDHHLRNAEKKRERAHWLHRIGLFLFALTLLMAALHAYDIVPPCSGVAPWITLVALIAPAFAGAVHATISQLELERVAERSARMALVLDEVAHEVSRARDVDELRRVVRRAADLMATENHEWWVLLRFQDVRLQA